MLNHEIIRPTSDSVRGWCLVAHGLGDSMDGWRPIVHELGIAGLGFVLVNAPNDYAMGYSWYQIPGLSGPDATPAGMIDDIRTSRGLVDELIEMLRTEHAVDPQQLLLMGFSQGCCIALETAVRSQHQLAGVIGISGTMTDFADLPDGFGPHATSLPVLQTHGTDDPVVPISLPDQSVAKLRALGVDVDYRIYPKVHSLDPYEELPELRAWIEERLTAVV